MTAKPTQHRAALSNYRIIGSGILCGMSEATYNVDNDDNTKELIVIEFLPWARRSIIVLFSFKLETAYLKITDSFLSLMMKTSAHLWSLLWGRKKIQNRPLWI